MMQQQINPPVPAAPDETGYYMPNETARQNESWVYGDPSLNGEQGSVQMPIPGMNGGDAQNGASSAAVDSLARLC